METLCFEFLPILANETPFVYSATYPLCHFSFLRVAVSRYFFNEKRLEESGTLTTSLHLFFSPHLTYKLTFFLTVSYSSRKKKEKKGLTKDEVTADLFLFFALSASYS